MIVKYFDMSSGGFEKTDFKTIFIEADNTVESDRIFTENFNRDPNNISCTCCGHDYAVSEYPSLANATAVDRMCQMSEDWQSFEEKPSTDEDAEYYSKCKCYMTLPNYLNWSDDIKVILKS